MPVPEAIPATARDRSSFSHATAALTCHIAFLSLLLASSTMVAHVAPAQGAPPAALVNGDLEQGNPGEVPSGWIVSTETTTGAVSEEDPAQGRRCALVTCDREGGPGFCDLMQRVDARSYRGQQIAVSAHVKYTGGTGKAQLWVRVDRAGKVMGFFDNMDDRPIRAGEWKRYEITGKVDDDAESINMGVFVTGGGTAWIDDVRLEVLPVIPGADAPPLKLTRRGLINVAAFARLLGYVRYFHPSDEVVCTDWSLVTMAGVERVEGAITVMELGMALQEIFAPLAPSVAVWVGNRAPEFSAPGGATHWLSWRHHGYARERSCSRPPIRTTDHKHGQELEVGGVDSPYSSRVTRIALADTAGPYEGTKPGTVVQVDFGERLHALVPVGVYAGAQRTLPEAQGTPAALQRPRGWRPSASDRTTRLAVVALAWSALQHFYPYFDVVEINFTGALREALWDASDDSTDVEFQATLERLGAVLHDGHTVVRGPRASKARPPIRWEWVGEELTVTATPVDSVSTAIKAGDVVEAIDGRAVSEIFAEVTTRCSAATDQHRRWRSLKEIGATPASATIQLTVRHPDGSREIASVPTSGSSSGLPPLGLPRNGTELAPGVRYFNLVGAETDTLVAFLPQLAAAKGVIFDLRGYPGSAGAELLQYLCTGPIQSANWNVPVITMPDRQAITYETSHWNITPERPRIGGKVVFVTDGRAVSYAESCLGIVEHYKLGEIVGSATAGTNGDVTFVSLPAGYSISFTGMQVTKQDGFRHHGVGILPTVPAQRTVPGIAAGRDELLETAIEVAQGQRR